MITRLEEQFMSLPTASLELLGRRLFNQVTTDGKEFYHLCVQAGYSQADVVLSIANQYGPVVIETLETLIGHPITRKRIEVAATVKRNRAVRADPRKITILCQDNPKIPGTKAFGLWQLYRDGMTCDEYVAAGGTRSALRYDSGRGFIKLER